jgi:hypothetical protein
MKPLSPHIYARLYVLLATAGASVIALAALLWTGGRSRRAGMRDPVLPVCHTPTCPQSRQSA